MDTPIPAPVVRDDAILDIRIPQTFDAARCTSIAGDNTPGDGGIYG